jgi:hypothetical protein
MSHLKLTIATTDYDHSAISASVSSRPKGIDHIWLNLCHHKCFARFTANRSTT